jgi:hypothetical protein
MVRPMGRPIAKKATTLEDLREESLAHCAARNLCGRTHEWWSSRRAELESRLPENVTQDHIPRSLPARTVAEIAVLR